MVVPEQRHRSLVAPRVAPFRTQLLLMVLLLVLPAFGLALLGHLEQRRIEKVRVRESTVALSRLAAASVEAYVQNTRQWLATLANLPFLVLTTNRAFCELHFANLLKLTPDYQNFGLIETNGILFCDGTGTVGESNLASRADFRRAVDMRGFSIGTLELGPPRAHQGLGFGYPVFDANGQLKRVLFAVLKPAVLMQSIAPIPVPAGGSLNVADRRGTILARNPGLEEWIGRRPLKGATSRRILAEGGGASEAKADDGSVWLQAATTIRDGASEALRVSIEVPRKTSFAGANAALARNVIVMAVVAGAVLLGARWYAERHFLQPVHTLSTAATRLADGQLGARTGRLSGPTELVQLGHVFDDMASRLQARQQELQQAREQIQRLNEDLERRVQARTEQLEAANKELEAFSYSVSHDLRAPLRHIHGFAAMLEASSEGRLTDKSLSYLKTISDAARRMGVLIDDLLLFSRTSRSELSRRSVDLEELARDVIRSLENETKGRQIKWSINPLPSVLADRALLRQAFINVLDNAVKYTRPRKVAEIEIGCQSQTPEEAVVYIRDNGVGFEMRYAHKLFGVFQRLHRVDEFEGNGIGLANVRRIVLRHQGRVWAESKLNEGTTLFVALPKV